MMPSSLDEKTRQNDFLRSLGEHSAIIIHELRGPLAAINANLQTMERILTQKGETSQQERFAILKDETLRMRELLDQYLLLAGTKPVNARPLFLNECAEQTLCLLRSLLIRSKVKYSISVEASTEPVLADERQIKQVLYNLVINAAEAMPDGGSLEITSCARSNEQLLIVQDNGCGMDQDTMSKVFQPYFTTKATGCGLGLAICRQIARENNGNLSVLSSPGKGTAFVLALPAYRA